MSLVSVPHGQAARPRRHRRGAAAAQAGDRHRGARAAGRAGAADQADRLGQQGDAAASTPSRCRTRSSTTTAATTICWPRTAWKSAQIAAQVGPDERDRSVEHNGRGCAPRATSQAPRSQSTAASRCARAHAAAPCARRRRAADDPSQCSTITANARSIPAIKGHVREDLHRRLRRHDGRRLRRCGRHRHLGALRCPRRARPAEGQRGAGLADHRSRHAGGDRAQWSEAAPLRQQARTATTSASSRSPRGSRRMSRAP